jgi:hypothetical protein
MCCANLPSQVAFCKFVSIGKELELENTIDFELLFLPTCWMASLESSARWLIEDNNARPTKMKFCP